MLQPMQTPAAESSFIRKDADILFPYVFCRIVRGGAVRRCFIYP